MPNQRSPDKKRVHAWLTKELVEKAEAEAQAKGMNLTEFIQMVVSDAFKQKQLRDKQNERIEEEK